MYQGAAASFLIKIISSTYHLEQRNELLQISKTSQADATRRALDMIDQLPHLDKYTNLLDVLKEAGWLRLYCFIISDAILSLSLSNSVLM